MCAAKIKEMDDVVWSDASTDLNLTSILEPIFYEVPLFCPGVCPYCQHLSLALMHPGAHLGAQQLHHAPIEAGCLWPCRADHRQSL